MIRTKLGNTKIETTKGIGEIMADVCCILASARDVLIEVGDMTEEEAWKEIDRAVDIAKKPIPEITAQDMEETKYILSALLKLLYKTEGE